MFGGGEGVGVGGVHDQHAGLGGGFGVDVVHADAGAGDGLELTGIGQFSGLDFDARANNHAIEIADDFGQFAGFPLLLDGQFHVWLGLENGQTFGRKRIGNKNIEHGVTLRE